LHLSEQTKNARYNWRKQGIIWFLSVLIGVIIGNGSLYFLWKQKNENIQFKAGQILETAWPKLNKKEQDKILNLGEKK